MNSEAQMTSLVDLIDRLIEPVEPAPVSMMPQTWAWAVLGLGILAVLAFAVWWVWRRHRTNAYRGAALRELRAAPHDAAAIAAILRRTALAAYPRSQVAGLAGEDWLHFLDQQIAGDGFVAGPGRIVATAPYDETKAEPGLFELAERWIRRHRSEGAT